MSTTTAIAIYFLIWWISLFAVLPFGVRSQQESGEFAEGTDPGAPVLPRLAMKLVWTTILASVVFGLLWAVYEYRLLTLEGVTRFFGMRR